MAFRQALEVRQMRPLADGEEHARRELGFWLRLSAPSERAADSLHCPCTDLWAPQRNLHAEIDRQSDCAMTAHIFSEVLMSTQVTAGVAISAGTGKPATAWQGSPGEASIRPRPQCLTWA